MNAWSKSSVRSIWHLYAEGITFIGVCSCATASLFGFDVTIRVTPLFALLAVGFHFAIILSQPSTKRVAPALLPSHLDESSITREGAWPMDIPLKMRTKIIWSAVTAGAIGVPGAFGAHADVPLLAGIWATLLVLLAKDAGAELDKAKATKIVAAIFLGISFFGTGFKLANTYFAYTVIGTLPAIIANVGANGSITYLFGKAAARAFLAEGATGPAESIGANILAIMVAMLKGNSGGPDIT